MKNTSQKQGFDSTVHITFENYIELLRTAFPLNSSTRFP